MPTKVKGTTGVDKVEAGAVITNPAFSGDATVSGSLTVGGVNVFSGPYRNLLINGDMRIAQRGTTPTTGNVYLIDRWKQVRVLSSIAVEMSQSTDVPTAQGFCNSIKLNVTSAGALSAGNYHRIDQKIEGQNIQHIKWGTASPEKLTLSFWVKSNYTGNFQASLNPASGAVNSIGFTVNSADTWEKKIITFTDTTTTAPLANDNTAQLSLYFYTAVGSSTFTETLNNYINITGVQLEVGEGASDFEFLPYDVQLQRCQRYYYKRVDLNTKHVGMADYFNSSTVRCGIDLPVTMRTIPSLDIVSGASYYRISRNGASDYMSALSMAPESTDNFVVITNNSEVSGTGGDCGFLLTSNSSAFIGFNAEL